MYELRIYGRRILLLLRAAISGHKGLMTPLWILFTCEEIPAAQSEFRVNDRSVDHQVATKSLSVSTEDKTSKGMDGTHRAVPFLSQSPLRFAIIVPFLPSHARSLVRPSFALCTCQLWCRRYLLTSIVSDSLVHHSLSHCFLITKPSFLLRFRSLWYILRHRIVSASKDSLVLDLFTGLAQLTGFVQRLQALFCSSFLSWEIRLGKS